MAADYEERDPPFQGGAQNVDHEAGDRPGRGRGPELFLITVLALLALAMPVAWGVGLIATLGEVLGSAALTALWIVWGIVVMLFLWTLWSMWRRAA